MQIETFRSHLQADQKTILRADELKKRSGHVLTVPACTEPPRVKTHWDFLLEEVHWIHRMYVYERRQKHQKSLAQANNVKKFFTARAAQQRPKTEIEEQARAEKEAKKHGAAIAKMVKEFWRKAHMLVDHGRKVRFSLALAVFFLTFMLLRKHTKLSDANNSAATSISLLPKPKCSDKR